MLTLNHAHYIHSASDLNKYPHWVDTETRQALSVFVNILWVQHIASGVWWPWCATETEVELLSQLDKGIDSLSNEQLEAATNYGLLHDPEITLAARFQFVSDLDDCRTKLARDRYCKLPSITFPAYQANVRHWMYTVAERFHIDQPLRRAYYAPPLFKVIHQQLTILIQQIAYEQLKPSYCYLGDYQTGAVLTKHTDRPQCRWNASITFARTGPIWPIWVETNGNTTPVCADIGEVIVYQGTEVPHWREELTSGTATVCFYHFVSQDFQDTLR